MSQDVFERIRHAVTTSLGESEKVVEEFLKFMSI
jgi:hypothetical protein